MFRLQFTRYLKSKFTYFILILMLVITEINNAAFGILHFENIFARAGDFYIMFWYATASFFGIFFCGNLVKDIQTNYLSYVVTRMPFRAYLKSTLLAQVAYVATIAGGFLVSILLFRVIAGGGSNTAAPLPYLVPPIFLVVIFLILTVLLFELLSVWIKNPYVLRILPFLYVVGLPAGTFMLGSIHPSLASAVWAMSFDASIDYYLLWLNGCSYGIYVLVFPVVSLLLISAAYGCHIRKYGKDLLI